MIKLRRTYDEPQPDSGPRFLVDRLWPRGIKNEALDMDDWLKAVAPSDDLRHWFGHDPDKWPEFQKRYFAELDDNPVAWQPILDAARQGNVTLLYSAKDMAHNNAVALKAYLEKELQGAKP